MPGCVWGPDDPYVGDSSQAVISFLRGELRVVNSMGTVPVVDVRDLASAIAATLQPSQGPRRYLMGGTPLSLVELTAEIARLTGTDRRRVAMPTGVVRASGLILKAVERLVALPLTSEMVGISIQPVRSVDDSRAVHELGFQPRPVAETIEDTIRWLANSGHLGKEAGRLAASV